MQKKLIALAVAGLASSAAFAQSNVTIYGLLQPSFDVIDTNGDKTQVDLQHNNSRIGFKGEEALGNGLKAIFQIESGVDLVTRGDAQGGVFAGRDSFAGFAGSFGSLTFGKHQTAYKKMADWADPFADSIGDYNNIMAVMPGTAGGRFGCTVNDVTNVCEDNRGGDEFNARRNKSMYYTSPNWSGFQLAASYALNDSGDTKAATADDTYSLAGTYKNGGLTLLAAFEETGIVGSSDELQGWKVGAGYKFSFGTQLNAIYEELELANAEANHFYIGAVHPITSNIDLMGSYIDASGNTAGGGDARNYNLGVNYKMSKRTSIQGIYTHLKNEDNGAYGLDAGYGPADGQTKVSGFSVRLRHAF